jgi:hypothetical protein
MGWQVKSIGMRYKVVFVVVSSILVFAVNVVEIQKRDAAEAEREVLQQKADAQKKAQELIMAQQVENAFKQMTPEQHLAAAQADLKVDATDQQLADATKNITALKGTSFESRGNALRTAYQVQKAQADARVKAAEAKAEAEARAKEAAYSNSRAGKLCAKHPYWTSDDCERLADHKIWIGMTLEMLKVNRGRPDHANPSNYGNGTSWQWCWDDYTPSCFYGGDDGIITSYN